MSKKGISDNLERLNFKHFCLVGSIATGIVCYLHLYEIQRRTATVLTMKR